MFGSYLAVSAMAIKGLTDKKAAFPRIGKLRKGGVKTGNKPGQDLDHFRFDSPDPAAMAAFAAAYGDRPQSVNVRLPYPTVEENWSAAMEKYGAGGLEIRCDREFMEGCRVNGRFVKCFPGRSPCQRDESQKDGGCGCKEVGRLNLIIPELQRFAYVTAETHSINDIVNLTQQLTAIEMMFGRLSGIPLVLTRRPEQISTPKADGGRARREKWLLSIEVSPEWASRQIEASDRHALAQAAQPLLGGAPLALAPAVDDFEADPSPPPLPSYDFTQSELWFNIKAAFGKVQNADDIQRYQAKALGYIDSGALPPHAKTMIFDLCDRASQKLADRRPPAPIRSAAPASHAKPTPAEPEIDPKWRDRPLWKDLAQEVSQATVDELPAFATAVQGYIDSEELPPAAGPEMMKLSKQRVAQFAAPVKSVPVEVV